MFKQYAHFRLVAAIGAVVAASLAVAAAFVLPERHIMIASQRASATQTDGTTHKQQPRQFVLGTATTTFFTSSDERKFNIALGAEHVSDVTVQPGDEYSFLENLGDVTEETGYKDEYVIAFGSTRKEPGGGICQVSTTLFRAAVDAGLPITERHGHGYVVGYYGPGLDATVYNPWRDLKFVNDTDNPIIVRSTVTDGEINFAIWGVPDGRSATTTTMLVRDVVEPPAPEYIADFSLDLGKEWCTERAITGMTTEVGYIVTMPDGTVREQNFETEYSPWGKKCYMGVKITP